MKSAIYQIDKIQSPYNCKNPTILELLDSRKIWVTENPEISTLWIVNKQLTKNVNKIHTSGAIRNNIRNFWQATPKEVLRSIGLGLGPPELEVGDKDGENGEIPLGVPQPFGDKNSGELA